MGPAPVSAETDRFPARDPYGSGPPLRPSFEFRAPPSATPMERPPLLTAATGLWFVAGLAGLVGALLPLLAVGEFHGNLVTVVERDYPQETLALRDRVVAVAAAVLVGGGILVALLEAGLAVALRSGRGGARVVLAMLVAPVGLHVLLMLSVVAPVSAGCLLVEAVLALAAAVLMYFPGTSTWLERCSRA